MKEATLDWAFFTEHLISFIIPFSRWRTWSPWNRRRPNAATSMFELGWWHLAAQNLVIYFTAICLAHVSKRAEYGAIVGLLTPNHLLHILSYVIACAVFLLVYSFRLVTVIDGDGPQRAPDSRVKERVHAMIERRGPLRVFDIDAGSTAPKGNTIFKRGWVALWLFNSHLVGCYPLLEWLTGPDVRTLAPTAASGSLFALMHLLCHVCSWLNVSYVLFITFECLTLFYYSRVDLMKSLNKDLANAADLSAAYLREWMDMRSLLRSFDRARWYGIESVAFCSLAFVILVGGYLARLEASNSLVMTQLNIRLMIDFFLCGSVLYVMGKVAEMSDREHSRSQIILSRRRVEIALSGAPNAAEVDMRIRAIKSLMRTDTHATRLVALRILQVVMHLLGLAGLYSAGRIAESLRRLVLMPALQRLAAMFA